MDFKRELAHLTNDMDRIDAAKGMLSIAENQPLFCELIAMDPGIQQVVRIAMSELHKEGSPLVFRIVAKKNEWGEAYKPGDVVELVRPKNMSDRRGHPVSGEELSMAMVSGEYSEKYETRKQFKLDSDCSFECNFFDAGYFMDQWGFHYKTKRPLKAGLPETSSEPVKRRDGSMKTVWYWRFCDNPRIDQAEKKKG